jgi:hypothetical protein
MCLEQSKKSVQKGTDCGKLGTHGDELGSGVFVNYMQSMRKLTHCCKKAISDKRHYQDQSDSKVLPCREN